MKSIRRLLPAAVACACLLTSCTTAPDAASVSGHAVSQSALDAELSQISSNHGYIAAVSSPSAPVSGVSAGTYDTRWTAFVLTNLITATAVHADLARTGRLPGPAEVAAATAVEAIDYAALWRSFPGAYRSTLVQRAADLAMLSVPPVPAAELTAVYKRYLQSWFTSLCVRTVSFPAGAKAAADALVARIDSAGNASSSSDGGSVTCYSATELPSQPAPEVAAVSGLPAGKAAAPVRASYGWVVYAVTSRSAIPDDAVLRRAIAVALTASQVDPAVEAILAHAVVHVDPAYGTWGGDRTSGYRVSPPSAPKA